VRLLNGDRVDGNKLLLACIGKEIDGEGINFWDAMTIRTQWQAGLDTGLRGPQADRKG